MNRRGFLGGLLATLAAPAIIRTPGLLMPVKRIILDEFSTDNLLVVATEHYAVGYYDWRLFTGLTDEQLPAWHASLNNRLAESFRQTKWSAAAAVLRAA